MEDLGERTFRFAVQVVKVCSRLPRHRVADVICYQLVKSGTSVGANWEEATAASSNADFVYKVEICERESRESNFWFRLLGATLLRKDPDVPVMADESRQLAAIFTSIGKKRKGRR